MDNDVPKVASWLDSASIPDNVRTSVRDGQNTAEKTVSNGLGKGYDLYVHMADAHISFWIGALLLMLTFLSWLMHTTGRTSRRGWVELTPAPAGHAQETLPLGPGGPPLAVEPVE